MYTSEYCGSSRDMPEDFTNTLNTARKCNPAKDITGMLFYDQGKFIQIIEGEQAVLNKLMTKLKSDPRHSNINILIDTETLNRELNDWNMEAFDISSHVGKDWALLSEFRDAYLASFKVSAMQLTKWIRHFVKDHEKVKRLLASEPC
jgi:hypothetical protein